MTKEALKRLIGDNIRRERISRNMTVDELAELLELTPGFVGLIERGRRGATVHNLYKLSEIFGIDIDRFTMSKSKPSLKVAEKNPAKTKRTKITSLIYQLDEAELEYIIAMIKNLKMFKKGSASGSVASYDGSMVDSQEDFEPDDVNDIDISDDIPAEPEKKEVKKPGRKKKAEQ